MLTYNMQNMEREVIVIFAKICYSHGMCAILGLQMQIEYHKFKK